MKKEHLIVWSNTEKRLNTKTRERKQQERRTYEEIGVGVGKESERNIALEETAPPPFPPPPPHPVNPQNPKNSDISNIG